MKNQILGVIASVIIATFIVVLVIPLIIVVFAWLIHLGGQWYGVIFQMTP